VGAPAIGAPAFAAADDDAPVFVRWEMAERRQQSQPAPALGSWARIWSRPLRGRVAGGAEARAARRTPPGARRGHPASARLDWCSCPASLVAALLVGARSKLV